MTGARRGRALAAGALVAAEVVAAVVLTLVLGLTWSEALDGFVVTNGLMGLSFGLCGAVIAWHRPHNPVGWLLVADGLGHATTAMAVPLAGVLADQGAPLELQRLANTVASWAWPWSIGLFLPLALLLFPTGKLPSPRWRVVTIAFVVTAPLFAIEIGTEPAPILAGTPTGYLTFEGHDDWRRCGSSRSCGSLRSWRSPSPPWSSDSVAVTPASGASCCGC